MAECRRRGSSCEPPASSGRCSRRNALGRGRMFDPGGSDALVRPVAGTDVVASHLRRRGSAMIGALPTSPLRRREERRAPWPRSGWSSPSSTRRSMPTRRRPLCAGRARPSTTRSASSCSTSAVSSRLTRSARRAAARARRRGPCSVSWGLSGLGVGVVGGALVGKLHHKDLGLEDADRERLGAALRGGKAAVGVLADPDELVAVESILVGHGGTDGGARARRGGAARGRRQRGTPDREGKRAWPRTRTARIGTAQHRSWTVRPRRHQQAMRLPPDATS